MPTSTKAAVYQRGGDVAVKDVPIAAPQAGELLVRVTACGVCSGEVLRWYNDRKAPFVLGHEPVAVVEGVGDSAVSADSAPFEVGERVFIHHHAPCMECRRCKRGDYVQCETWRATRLQPGGMSQFAIVPAASVRSDVLRIPEEIDDDRATFIEPLATVVKSLRRSSMREGDRVLVIGLGVMGMLHIALARARGAALVMGADRVASRVARAADVGAHAAFDVGSMPLQRQVMAATGGEGADIVIVGPGTTDALESAALCVAPGGTIVIFTPTQTHERWQFPVHDFYFKDISVVASYSAGPNDTREALDALASGLRVGKLVTHRYGLDRVAEAYRTVAAAQDALKVIVYPNKST
jgi:L-iditol 2-dehydrogenase